MSLNMDMKMIRSPKFSGLMLLLCKSSWIFRTISNEVRPGISCPFHLYAAPSGSVTFHKHKTESEYTRTFAFVNLVTCGCANLFSRDDPRATTNTSVIISRWTSHAVQKGRGSYSPVRPLFFCRALKTLTATCASSLWGWGFPLHGQRKQLICGWTGTPFSGAQSRPATFLPACFTRRQARHCGSVVQHPPRTGNVQPWPVRPGGQPQQASCYFVSVSATLIRPLIFSTCRRPFCTNSWSHMSFTSTCLMRPRPRVDEKDFAAAESVIKNCFTSIPSSSIIDWSPRPREAPSLIPYNSASAADVATTDCVDDQVRSGSASSLAASPITVNLDFDRCCLPLILPRVLPQHLLETYRTNSLRFKKSWLVGEDIFRQNSFAANWIVGWSCDVKPQSYHRSFLPSMSISFVSSSPLPSPRFFNS